ncbi:hypothetical protein T440DRAFT_474808 [Plenodomus tracheiphilus IPT5]|uniref:DUF6594 domain-containing protein n=1 Tax=Plenodomus tracheiphilus IPT5 TaxID=1408161 RepID=A0A6A7BJ19_9PLEO|nr:hypothetical protein T440DRAFT_474808 [Plenodomus tracheiphilus IPT5]
MEHAQNRSPLSVRERITELYDHREQYKTIDKQPELGIFLTFGPERSFLSAYLESEIFHKSHTAQTFLRENAHKPEGSDVDNQDVEKKYHNVMRELKEEIFDYSKYFGVRHRGKSTNFVKGHLFEISRCMATSPTPSLSVLDSFRIRSSVGEQAKRAANGQLLSIYGEFRGPVPPNLTTAYDGVSEPMARLLYERLMDPFIDHVAAPLLSRLRRLGIFSKAQWTQDSILERVDLRIIHGLADIVMSMMAILSLAIPIGILNVIQRPELRIVFMALFSPVYALLAQLMGPRSILLNTLIAAYFQVMSFSIGTASEQS